MLSLKDHGCYQDLKFWFEISEIPPLTEMLISRPKLSVFLQIFMNLVKFYSNPFKIVKISKKKFERKNPKFLKFQFYHQPAAEIPLSKFQTLVATRVGLYMMSYNYDLSQIIGQFNGSSLVMIPSVRELFDWSETTCQGYLDRSSTCSDYRACLVRAKIKCLVKIRMIWWKN